MATVVSPPSRTTVLSLFRSFLRSARQFPDYNIKEYTKRRTIDAFHSNKTLSNPSSVAAAFADGNYQLQVVVLYLDVRYLLLVLHLQRTTTTRFVYNFLTRWWIRTVEGGSFTLL
ncbi:unnamed protein product [Lactuca saligna]|uniref:Complex 1 LYR protein domain-containing protein n=1 Tax=Lactuca saligna TaxID=75948 RepID=A0AA35VPC8_LACSI|nr:unnamed protein product [Lactuca saligna]